MAEVNDETVRDLLHGSVVQGVPTRELGLDLSKVEVFGTLTFR